MMQRSHTLGSRLMVQRQQQTRNFGINPNDILKRITSTKSIEKITKSMKMVSASKLRGDQNRLVEGRLFGAMIQRMCPPVVSEEGELAAQEHADAGTPFHVLVSSDRGLCGGVNSFAAKRTKRELNYMRDEQNTVGKIFIIGEKGSSQILRSHGSSVVGSVDETWKNPTNFAKVCNVAQRVLPAAEDSAVTRFVFNKFVTAVSYTTSVAAVPNFPKLAEGADGKGEDELPAPFNLYEIEPDVPNDFLKNMFEYATAVQLYSCCLENATSEQSARMSAMDNATKNANEMIDSLTVLYNRARQAKITTELNEIISGAESLKG
jgi:F-type H+-transporting ATPase subunit gamma